MIDIMTAEFTRPGRSIAGQEDAQAPGETKTPLQDIQKIQNIFAEDKSADNAAEFTLLLDGFVAEKHIPINNTAILDKNANDKTIIANDTSEAIILAGKIVKKTAIENINDEIKTNPANPANMQILSKLTNKAKTELNAADIKTAITKPEQNNTAPPQSEAVMAGNTGKIGNTEANIKPELVHNVKAINRLDTARPDGQNMIINSENPAAANQSNNLPPVNIADNMTANITSRQQVLPNQQAGNIAIQIGESLTEQIQTLKNNEQGNNKLKPITVQLSPAELGRVTIRFSFNGPDNIIANIISETNEANFALKHKSDVLIGHLRQGGFENIQLDFTARSEPFLQNNMTGFNNTFANKQTPASEHNGYFDDMDNNINNEPDEETIITPGAGLITDHLDIIV